MSRHTSDLENSQPLQESSSPDQPLSREQLDLVQKEVDLFVAKRLEQGLPPDHPHSWLEQRTANPFLGRKHSR